MTCRPSIWLLMLAGLAGTACSCGRTGPTGDVTDTTRDYQGKLPVFPGAEGFGTDSPAGRGGIVVRVTSLADSGPGSLREALLVAEPRVVVFEVGGMIWLTSNLNVDSPFVTIAGQTAPSPGISIAGAPLVIRTHDVLVQHLRMRIGDRPGDPRPDDRDGIEILGGDDPDRLDTFNVIVDHCSISWAIDEGVSTWYTGVGDVTIRRSIISEQLSSSLHYKGEHSMGLLVGDHSKRITVVGNLLAHNRRRNPMIKGDVSALVVNNVVYDAGNQAVHFGDAEGSGPSRADVVGNVVLPGPSSLVDLSAVHVQSDVRPGSLFFVADNEGPRRSADPWSIALVEASFDVRGTGRLVSVTPLAILPSSEVEAWVLAGAGARPADRDAVDARIVREVTERSGRIIDSPEEVGGWPPLAETSRAAILPANPNEDDDADGYTNLEEWLHAAASAVE